MNRRLAVEAALRRILARNHDSACECYLDSADRQQILQAAEKADELAAIRADHLHYRGRLTDKARTCLICGAPMPPPTDGESALAAGETVDSILHALRGLLDAVDGGDISDLRTDPNARGATALANARRIAGAAAGEPAAAPLRVGDRVRYTGGGRSGLDGGPGEVVEVMAYGARVRVLTPCDVAGNRIEAGEVLVFAAHSLARDSGEAP